MGLSNFPCLAEGVVPVLVMNTVFSVALLKNLLRSALQVIAGSDQEQEDPYPFGYGFSEIEVDNGSRERRVSITKFKPLCGYGGVECSVCLCGFEEEEEVSELSCKHFFHRSCLDKWFHNKHTTCPLCRSIS